MLVEFSVGNAGPFKDIQTLNMVAAPISSKNKELDEQNTFQATSKLRLLKTKAIYGANGSGKSNLISSMMCFKLFLRHSLQENAFNRYAISSFLLSDELENQPSFLQIIIIINGIVYRYGYETNKEGIVSEWLFGVPNQREVYYFKRNGQDLDINDKYLRGARKIQNLLGNESPIFKKTSLFLSVLSSLNNKVALDIDNYFNHFLIDTSSADTHSFETLKREMATEMYFDGIFKGDPIQLLKFTDSGIENMGIAEVNNNGEKEKVVIFIGNKFDKEKNIIGKVNLPFFSFASEGTKKVFDIAPLIQISLNSKSPFIIDEFDSKLHPIITKKIVELYNKNENNAQLIFVTHDTNLLDYKLLRRDQIAFIEKDKYGASHLYDLVEFKGVRNDASFEKDYLDGRYGAIPFVGNFEYVFSK
jgi:uncharacterized protein